MSDGTGGTLRRVADVRAGEWGPVALASLLNFLVIGAAGLVKPVRQSAFLDALGANAYPFALLATAVVVGGIMLAYARLAEKVRTARLVVGTYFFLALNLVVFWWLMKRTAAGPQCDPCPLLSAPVVLSAVFFVWAQLYSVLTVSQFWLTANISFDTRQAKRLFGLVGVGGIIGGIVGSWAAGVLAGLPSVGRVNIVLTSALTLVLAAGAAAALLARSREEPPPTRQKGAAREAGAGRLVWESPHLRAVATILLVIIIVSALADQQLNSAVDRFLPKGDARTAFFGRYYAVTNIISLLVQVFVTGFVLKRFGVGMALLLLPVAMLGASVGLLFAPTLIMAAVVRGADQSLRYSLDQSTRELLFLPVPRDIKSKVKPFIDVAVQRGGKGVSAIIALILLTWLGVPFQYLGVASVFAIGIWLVCVLIVRREYVSAIKRMIAVRDVDVDELVVQRLDADARRELADAARSGNRAARRYAAALLAVAGEESLGEREKHRARYPSLADVGERAEQVKAEIARGVSREQAEAYVADPVPRVRAAGVAALLVHSDASLRDMAEDALRAMAHTPGPQGAPQRREAALVAGSVPPSTATLDVLTRLTRDASAPVRVAALVAAAHHGRRELLPAFLMAATDPETREDARDALATLAPRTVGALGDALRDPGEAHEARVQAARALAGVPGPLTVPVLEAALADPHPDIRYHALKALNRLRRTDAGTAMSPASSEAALAREMACVAVLAAARTELKDSLAARRGGALLSAALDERRDDAIERLGRALGMVYPLDDMLHAYRAVTSGDAAAKTSGLELLDNVLSAEHRRVIVPLLERGQAPAAPAGATWKNDPWLVTCAAHAGAGPTNLEAGMPSVLERAEFLRNVEFLSLVRTEYLAKVAAVMSEATVAPSQEILKQGEGVEQVHVLMSGKMAARRDGQVLFIFRKGDAIGALSVLDGKQSPFTAVALEPSSVLSVSAEEFKDLMMDNSAIMLGLLRYLAGQVRDLSARAREAGTHTTIS